MCWAAQRQRHGTDGGILPERVDDDHWDTSFEARHAAVGAHGRMTLLPEFFELYQ
jgi:hypothetical protein